VTRKRLTVIAAISIILLITGGCAHLLYPAHGTEESLRERVNQEWMAKMSKNIDMLYDLTTDEFKKETPRKSFHFASNVPMTGFTITKLELFDDGARAIAAVDMHIQHMGFKFKFPSREEWLWQRGAWRLNMKKHKDVDVSQLPFNKKK